MRIILTLIAITLTACGSVPYAEIGAGASLESGEYFAYPSIGGEINEACFLFHAGAGLAWSSGIEIRVDHRSCIASEPEIATNQILLIKRLSFR